MMFARWRNAAPVRWNIERTLTRIRSGQMISLSKFMYIAKRAFCVGHIAIYASYTYVRSSVAIGPLLFDPFRSGLTQFDAEMLRRYDLSYAFLSDFSFTIQNASRLYSLVLVRVRETARRRQRQSQSQRQRQSLRVRVRETE